MTLIIGTVSAINAIITTDGLSIPHPKTGRGIGSDSYQKIFPVPNLPIAFVNHGFNILGEKSSIEFLQSYVSSNYEVMKNSSLEAIVERLRAYSEDAVKCIFANPDNKGGIGFWIAGFARQRNEPEIYEIFWPDRPDPHKLCQKAPWVLGGDGKEFLDPLPNLTSFQIVRFHKWSASFMLQYHRALYSHAELMQKGSDKTIFGGHQQQLIIEKTGWRWVIPPKPQNQS